MSSSTAALHKRWAALLSATLEAWTHQILYVRHVYPRETFGPTNFLGVRCHANRHPGVVSYIDETIRVAVPAMVSGTADEIALIIMDGETEDKDDTKARFEKYTLRFSSRNPDWASDEEDTLALMQSVERGMRDLVLQVHSLESTPFTSKPNVTFKLKIRIPEENKTCPELNQSFADGTMAISSHPALLTSASKEPIHATQSKPCLIHFVADKK